MFVAQPDPYLVPDYKISPFCATDIGRNRHLPVRNDSDDYFRSRHPGFHIRYTTNGREAIHLALAQLKLGDGDLVTILTTTQNRYISSCVTREVEKFCRWNRAVTNQTKVIIVIHEFGFVYPGLDELKRSVNVPIIEDCAYSFFSGDAQGLTGRVGEYVVYSFPKMFPLQEGGLLASVNQLSTPDPREASAHQHYRNVMSVCLRQEDDIIRARRHNYAYLLAALRSRGCEERLPLSGKEVPGALLFKCPEVDLEQLKVHMTRHGIQCSVFYGEQAFFLPVHQALTNDDLDYFLFVFDTFLNRRS